MYSIAVLKDEEFEALPYPEMEDSLGLADPSTNKAYIRYTGLPHLDKYLINHELDHLIDGAGGEHSDHYRNGVYYKKLIDAFSSALPTIGTVVGSMFGGPVGGAAGGGLGSFGSSRMNVGKRKDVMNRQAEQANQGGTMGGFGLSPTLSSENQAGVPRASSTESPMSGFGRRDGASSWVERIRGFFAGRNPQQEF